MEKKGGIKKKPQRIVVGPKTSGARRISEIIGELYPEIVKGGKHGK